MFSNNIKFHDQKRKVVHSSKLSSEAINNGFVDVTEDIKDAVKCYECDKVHPVPYSVDRVDFITIYGTVLVNDGGGILGNGDWDNHGVKAYHFCPTCLKEFIDKTVRGR